jgi:hypothetical protein
MYQVWDCASRVMLLIHFETNLLYGRYIVPGTWYFVQILISYIVPGTWYFVQIYISYFVPGTWYIVIKKTLLSTKCFTCLLFRSIRGHDRCVAGGGG